MSKIILRWNIQLLSCKLRPTKKFFVPAELFSFHFEGISQFFYFSVYFLHFSHFPRIKKMNFLLSLGEENENKSKTHFIFEFFGRIQNDLFEAF